MTNALYFKLFYLYFAGHILLPDVARLAEDLNILRSPTGNPGALSHTQLCRSTKRSLPPFTCQYGRTMSPSSGISPTLFKDPVYIRLLVYDSL